MKSSVENNIYTLEDVDRKQKWMLTGKENGLFVIEEAATLKKIKNLFGHW